MMDNKFIIFDLVAASVVTDDVTIEASLKTNTILGV